MVVQKKRRLARRRRALEGRPTDADDGAAAAERRQHLTQPLSAGDGVELVAALGESGRRVEVVVGSEGDDEDIRLVGAPVRLHPPRFGIDRGDGLAQEADSGFVDVGVGQADLLGRRPAEHHVELRVAEDEGVVLVDQRDAGVAAERLGQESRELETAEARTQNDEACLHRTNLTIYWPYIASRASRIPTGRRTRRPAPTAPRSRAARAPAGGGGGRGRRTPSPAPRPDLAAAWSDASRGRPAGRRAARSARALRASLARGARGSAPSYPGAGRAGSPRSRRRRPRGRRGRPRPVAPARRRPPAGSGPFPRMPERRRRRGASAPEGADADARSTARSSARRPRPASGSRT